MTKSKVFWGTLIILAILFGLVTTVYAQPSLPSSFYGSIQISDNPPAVGDLVKAYVPGVPGSVGTAAIKMDGSNKVYNLNVLGDIIDTPTEKEGGAEGDVVTFKIGNRIVATGIWHSGTNVNLDFHPPEPTGGPYSGTVDIAIAFSGSANDSGADATKYEWDWNNDGTFDETAKDTTHTWTDYGTYTVGLRVTDVQNGEGVITFDVDVAKGTAEITLGDLNPTFDGTSKEASVTTDPAGLSYSITYAGSPTGPTDAGDYAVEAVITDPNYTGSASGTLVIKQASSTTIISGGGTFVYNGSPRPATVSITGAGGLSLTLEPEYSGSCTAAPVNVVETPCTASYTFVGDKNHTGSTGSDTITITPKPITVTADSGQTKVYGSADPTFTYTPSELVTFTGSLSRDPGTDVGAYPIRKGDLSAGSNYSIDFVTADFTITKAPADVELSNVSQTYDGSPKEVTVTTDPLGLAVDITYDGSSTKPTDAKSYDVVATVNDKNYEGSASGTLVIGKASSTTTISGWGTFTYDGSTHPATVLVTGAGGLNLTPAPEYTGSCTAAPVNVTETPCTASYTYTGDANHTGSSDSKTITITPASATVVLSNLNHVHDGSQKFATATTDPVGLSVSITYNGSTTAPSAAGSYEVIATITDTNYTGSDTETMTISAFHSISLVPGWNLVSFSLHPASIAVEDVLSSISGNYDLVYAWDATGGHSGSGNWLRADNNPMTTDTLVNLDETMGFWIHMTVADSLEVVGSVPGTSNISLSTNASGWNLVGYPSAGSGTLPGALTTNSTMVYAYHALDSGDPWKLFDRSGAPYANDLTSLTAGWGYWIYVTSAEIWSIGY